ncbi:hypothetical protein HPB51_006145 [Rhipicephalus microplus]|uniref:Uncharacterized protein n=1 Tax=Rhipicephalus microplus TaxID=6941 RepID=A0A9J6ERT1_RHIMP|nr:hypothetical protein HPB51_006145 [Rhipicephalus microplus]
MEPWYSGLPKNYHLRMVAVDLSLCTAEECGLFVEAVARAPVRSVTVSNVADDGCLQALYDAIRRHNVLHKVTVEDVHLGPADVKVLPCYPETSVVTLSSSHFPDVPALCGAIRELAVCRHISSLRLRFDSYDESLYSATADVMAILGPTVREVKLHAEDFYEADDENRVACQNRLIKAVTSNRNLTRLKLHVAYLNAACCQFVADSVLNSWTLCELSLEALEVPSCAMFLRCLIPGVARNHSLLVASLPDCGDKLGVEMATLQDVAGRNVRFLALASRFVIHYRYGDPYGRDVLPLVAKHPNLVEMVARDGSVTETEAKSMVEGALQIVAPGPYA